MQRFWRTREIGIIDQVYHQKFTCSLTSVIVGFRPVSFRTSTGCGPRPNLAVPDLIDIDAVFSPRGPVMASKVFLALDNRVFREALARLLRRCDCAEVCGASACGIPGLAETISAVL